jgi:hypothetical protein
VRLVPLILSGVIIALISAPAQAGAQTTLVVRRAAQAHPTIEAAVDEVLRTEFGSSARRVEISLGDLALAAGCGEEIDRPDCMASIARAASADLVAVEHVRREGEVYQVHVVLYGSAGERLRTLDAECVPGHCEGALATAVHGRDPAIVNEVPPNEPSEVTPSSGEDIAVGTSSARTWEPRTTARPAGGSGATSSVAVSAAPDEPSSDNHIEIRASTVMYTGAAITGLGAIISGIVSADASSRAADLGVVRTRAGADTLIAAEQTRDGALVTGVALAIAGAGLAVTAVVLQTTEHDVRVTALSVAGGAMLECGATF